MNIYALGFSTDYLYDILKEMGQRTINLSEEIYRKAKFPIFID
jgi:hypothetical protein